MSVVLHQGDCLDVMRGMGAESVDSIVTDPPYHLTSIVKRFGSDGAAPARSDGATGVYKRASTGFMGKRWDGGDIAYDPATWAEALRVLKPGGHLAAFGGSRGYHRMACAIEDAGFEIRDSLMWLYGTGFPKSHDVAKGIEKALGVGRPEADEWEGFGTALKPAFEPIVLARKPLSEKSVAANVLRWRTGALNIDGCRVGSEVRKAAYTSFAPCHGNALGAAGTAEARRGTQGEPKEYIGRWPANVVHDGSDEVVAAFPTTTARGHHPKSRGKGGIGNDGHTGQSGLVERHAGDSGSAARFFYSAKASKADRAGSKHPTVKPVALMQWLCRLVTPPGGVVLDPFAGSGTTGAAAVAEGFKAVLIEREDEYAGDIRRRLDLDDAPAGLEEMLA